MSCTTNLKSILSVTMASGGGGARARNNDLGPHDHLIPRTLHWSSKESRRTFEMVRGRSTGIFWPSFNGSYLFNGFLVKAHSVDRIAVMRTAHYEVARKTSVVSKCTPGELIANAPHIQGSSN